MKPEMKKLIIANLPYLLFVYLFGKLGQAYRLAEGIDLSQKLLHFADGCAAAFANAAPSFNPFDLLIGVAGAAALRLMVYCKGKTKLHHGQQSLKQLKKHGAALSNIEITDANIGLFKPCAKKYGVDFTLRKDATTQPPHYIVIFKAKDADNMEQAFKEFTAKKLQREERPSIRKNIAASKEKAAARNADRAKEKFKERGLSR